MRNFIQNGDFVTVIAPHDIKSGEGVLVNSLFGVAAFDAFANSELELLLEGIFKMAKSAIEIWQVGEKIYWNAEEKYCTNVSEGNSLIGVSLKPAANPSNEGIVRLNSAFI
jgi:predicted RecA/RadA family phage recombinase